jgi:secreted trypsin-like serine protease
VSFFGYLRAQNCGQRKVQTSALIVNGFTTSPGEFPWHAAIFHVHGVKRDYACGGTLINEYQVVTAAHCLVDQSTASAMIPDAVLVQLGAFDLVVTSPHAIELKAHSISVHEKYTHSTHKNDIAVITLKAKVNYNDFVQPACIYESDAEDLAKKKASAVAVGWGITETDETSSVLKAANLPIVGYDDCVKSNPDIFEVFLTENNICAGYRNGTTVCNGDSGRWFYPFVNFSLFILVPFQEVVYSTKAEILTILLALFPFRP